jgi:hypothetical protein
MLVTITVPDEFAAALFAAGQEPARVVLEALGLEAYRQRRGYQLRLLLGMESRYALEGFLKEHNVYDYTVDDFEHDLATIRELENKRQSDRT